MTFQSDLINLLSMDNFRGLSECLDWENRRQFSIFLCQQIIKMEAYVSLPAHLSMVLNFMSPLIAGNSSNEPETSTTQVKDLSYEQDILLRSLWFFSSENHEEEFEVRPKTILDKRLDVQLMILFIFVRFSVPWRKHLLRGLTECN